MRIKKPAPMPLGSGLYDDMAPAPNGMPLGSGLFGMAMPPVELAPAGAPQTASQPAPSGDDKFMALIGNPMFQYGMNLLGASNTPNPWGTALNNTLAAQATLGRGKRDQRLADLEEQQMQQRAAQAQLEHERALRNIGVAERNAATGERNADLQGRELDARLPLFEAQAKNYGAQAALEGQNMQLKRQEAERQQQFLQQIMPMLQGGGLMQPQAPQMQPQSGAGGYGTPPWLLDSLAQVESSGNPKAVNPQSGAMGMYQFMPGTVEMLAKKGKQFDPMDPVQARDAADFYLADLLKANGGDVYKALQSYGGFVTKDPSQYIGKVMKGAPASVTAQAPAGDSGLNMARAGTLAALGGLKGGQQLVELGKMMQPQSATPGSFLRDPASGSMTQVPDPKGDKQLELQGRGVAVQESQEQRAGQKAQAEKRGSVADLEAGWRGTDASLRRLEEGATKLQSHKGLDTIGGWSGFLGLHKLPGAGKDADTQLETLKSKLVVGAMQELKKLSSTGATGFGQLSEKEGQRLETLETNLAAAQSEKQLKAAVGDIATFARESRERHKQHYQSLLKAQGEQPAPEAAPAALPLSEYLKIKRGGK